VRPLAKRARFAEMLFTFKFFDHNGTLPGLFCEVIGANIAPDVRQEVEDECKQDGKQGIYPD
jgi:hypothetical protein